MYDDDGLGRWPPWSRMPSLKEMSEEVGIDFDDLVKAIRTEMSPSEMSQRFDISEELASNFTEHFFRYGIGSVMSGD